MSEMRKKVCGNGGVLCNFQEASSEKRKHALLPPFPHPTPGRMGSDACCSDHRELLDENRTLRWLNGEQEGLWVPDDPGAGTPSLDGHPLEFFTGEINFPSYLSHALSSFLPHIVMTSPNRNSVFLFPNYK